MSRNCVWRITLYLTSGRVFRYYCILVVRFLGSEMNRISVDVDFDYGENVIIGKWFRGLIGRIRVFRKGIYIKDNKFGYDLVIKLGYHSCPAYGWAAIILVFQWRYISQFSPVILRPGWPI